MRALVDMLAQAVVDHPEQITVVEQINERGIRLDISAHPDDVGKIIGKQGRVIRAIRTVASSAAIKEGTRVQVEINA